jgi:hypothetical protein
VLFFPAVCDPQPMFKLPDVLAKRRLKVALKSEVVSMAHSAFSP